MAETRTSDGAGPALRARGLGHDYAVGRGFGFGFGFGRGRAVVLRGLELELARGGALGLLGPNGSGKSTLLRLCAGLERPRAGELEVLGLAPQHAAARARVGYCPEDSPWPAELELCEALELRALADGRGRASAAALAGEWLDAVGLSDAARTRLGACSRGMLRRFGLAQALLGEPELVLLDEPTAGLDAEGLQRFDGLLARARARGATLVLSSHVLGDLARHCDRIALLHAGRLVAQGRPDELARGARELEFELERPSELALEHLVAALAAAGARSIRVRPGARALVELYRSDGSPGADGGLGSAP